jgi:hypothetical protein
MPTGAARKALADAGSVAMTEWDSADEARAFFQSKAWKDLAPEGEKTAKTIRRYIVEVEP